MMLLTVFNSTNILSYSSSTGSDAGDLALSLAGGLIQLLGFIAFIRGWILLTTYGKQQQQSGIGKAVTHIIAGLLGVNIYATWDILKNTIGI
jgi:intracellular multiplication protein IcmC